MWWYRLVRAAAFVMILAAVILGRGKETDRMLAYMEDKYREEFVYIEDYAGQMGKPYKMIRVRSRQKPEREALVRSIYLEEKTVRQDNYQACLLKREIEEIMYLLAEPVLGDGSVWYKQPFMVFPEEFPADMEADAFLRHPQSMVRIYFYPQGAPENAQEQVQKLCEILKKKGYALAATVSWLEHEETPAISFSTFNAEADNKNGGQE